jgi:quercetin dioxygenase-like cupin family protein
LRFDAYGMDILCVNNSVGKEIGMHGKSTNERYTEILPAITIKTLVHGKSTIMTKFILSKGSALPKHQHPFEQTGYLLKGRIRLLIGGELHDVGENDSWCIEPGVEHSAEIIEDSIALEIFSPVRPDYLKYHSRLDVQSGIRTHEQ